ncbi:flavorubredoxin [Lachnotalea glycerini]|uniref:Flavorubredoxin n=1 Tax=Lachnotalea glycerini TaxID=1763509 RepID=A0A255I5V9_9FIRM|nr:FprA family A-type flavoprotein [Lachnotalea glycerini]PXV93857.1 flavorubredoxin [Lachnotalea glycerini]RDY30905.1 FprA family A-type flavoprotein [Lachnotalea glycerini]
MNKITESILYVGCNDKDLDLFEGQYSVPNGISYNSYVILDEKVAVMDTADKRVTDEWMRQLEEALNGRVVDFLIVSHMEPDHAANIKTIVERYPNLKIVGNAKTFNLISQFFDIDISKRKIEVKESDTLNLGNHTLQFFMAPMVHWPEVMVTYEQSEKILFSADAFGKFGVLNIEDNWIEEARRYYFNIVGKYGAPVQTLLKKAANLEIAMICPLHGPVLKEGLEYYLDKYNTWSKYEAEEEGILVAYASIYGNTANAAIKIAELLNSKGKKAVLIDLARTDKSRALEYAFMYSKMVVAASSYDASVFPCMHEFLLRLQHKNYQNRSVAIIENGSWAPSAGRVMKELISTMKNVEIYDTLISIKSTMNEENIKQIEELAERF